MNPTKHPTFILPRLCGVLALFLAAFSAPAWAVWPQSFGGNGDDEIVVVRHASNGDVYIAGHFSGTMQVGFDTLTSQGGQDVFVARLSATGQVLWARSAGSIVGDRVNDMVLDPAYNVYLVGEFSDTAVFGGIELFADGPYSDAFVAKINPSGDWQWARRMGGAGSDAATGVVPLPGNSTVIPQIPESVLVVGRYECQATFGKDANNNDVALSKSNCFQGASDLFAARFKANGETIWAVDRGGSATRVDAADHIAIDGDNRVYIAGSEAQGGLVTRLNDPFNNLANWDTSNSNFGRVFPGSGSVSYTAQPGTTCILAPNQTRSYSIFTGTNHLVLRGGTVNVDSVAYNTSGRQMLRISLEAMRGGDFGTIFNRLISEYPDFNENLEVRYLDSDLQWRLLESFPGGGGRPGLEMFSRTNEGAYLLTPETHPKAFHSGFRIRLRLTGGTGGPHNRSGINLGNGLGACYSATNAYWDWWHVDNLRIDEIGVRSPFVLTMSNVLSDTPSFSAPTALPSALSLSDMAVVGSGGSKRLMLHGTTSDDTVLSPCLTSGSGAYVASLNANTLSCVWAKVVANAKGGAIATDSTGNLYVTGSFTGSATFSNDPGGTLEAHPGGADVYVASYSDSGVPLWATGGNRHDPTGVPSFAGGGGDDRGQGIATDGASTVYVGGRFEAVAQFGQSDSLAAIDMADAFLINLGTDGRFFEEEKWIAGVPLVPPANAKVDDVTFAPQFA
ncbi:MAG TPA: hypothetical protein PKZ76_01885, partial [Xanthomonadaceae bacterium]|nr:hypothetical protein [Xanthomonadaceae bacterium]